jgi:A/G-specific adenine glycosylase
MARSADPQPDVEPLPAFAPRLLAWQRTHGRHDLPWQVRRTPYRVWLSEVMLQQTQVATALPYFERFCAALPDLPALARAPLDEVLALWSGLGYYSRARNLHRAAALCAERHGGEVPDDFAALLALPGIGRSTAGAILAQAFGRRAAILDGNVKRVLCRSHAVDGFPGQPQVERRLWRLADALLPDADLPAYTQAVMDLGATVCVRTRPACPSCPLRADCRALAADRVAELPVPRPGRLLPERSAAWWLLVDADDRVLLERRPERGIWGGLWSLPEFPDADAAATALALRLGSDAGPPRALAPIRHVFSHFALHAQPLHWRLQGSSMAVADGAGERWLTRHELAALGLPQPVRQLLAAHRFDD